MMYQKVNYEKYIHPNWEVDVMLPDGRQFTRKYITEFRFASWFATGVEAALNLALGLNISRWPTPDREELVVLSDNASGFKYVRIRCEQGEGLTIKPDTQMDVDGYTDYLTGGYRWVFDPPVKRGLRMVGDEIVYRDYWVTGGCLYATNDSTKDSLELPNLRGNVVIEFPIYEANE